MHPQPSTNYLSGYPTPLVEQVHRLITQDQLAAWLLSKYPQAHSVRTDKALYAYVHQIKSEYLRNVAQLSKVTYDSKMHIIRNALGTHSTVSRVQGAKLRSKQEIRIATLFRDMPLEFLRMIVVHELAHTREPNHDKAFYQLCQYMEPEYMQLEFELRAYLTYLDGGGTKIWVVQSGVTVAIKVESGELS